MLFLDIFLWGLCLVYHWSHGVARLKVRIGTGFLCHFNSQILKSLTTILKPPSLCIESVADYSMTEQYLWPLRCVIKAILGSDNYLQCFTIHFVCLGSLPLLIYSNRQWGTAVAQWLRCRATNRKVACSIPAGVMGIFHWHKILPFALWPWGRLSL